ncbi:hypothetical protein [Lentzea tibetensis]|uniref:hypothetical protein n=1 Tax=Lentzea tibetensis TaxID=2591470 RepID=UPI001C994D08
MLAEEAGFDRVWAVEHHGLRHHAHMSAPEIFLTIATAAAYGVGALVLGFGGPDHIRELRGTYDKAIGEHLVSTEVNDHFAALCPTVVLPDRDRAREVGLRGQRFFVIPRFRW